MVAGPPRPSNPDHEYQTTISTNPPELIAGRAAQADVKGLAH